MALAGIAKKIFGSANDRRLKPMWRRSEKINALEEEMIALSDEDLIAQTAKFRARLEAGETLDQLLEEAFATVREAAKRALGQRHYDVQMLGGMVLHEGDIAEMKTGEGKTITATLPMYLMGLTGKGAHLVTVNDYLAERDAAEMGVLYEWLGLSCGCILSEMENDDRKSNYAKAVSYTHLTLPTILLV